ncbi:MaoC family dehydratase N-terminal domain-containing protein [Rhodococcus sp. Z13]|uniref:MaoC family dehydratase N-terminal domain-containing protein n=1 Tax=Rhodococcus sacchari TaxID=2962047 RepID=A0ACD4DFI4_9NOCA|nr:MaoC family dehydratase N-terminal domain-containing protein [Rhodococcus sp. Z13]UYP18830.1 MaoC family dehydratase N-terminal domain-containing protein [Rhodococcus sp. Z13]
MTTSEKTENSAKTGIPAEKSDEIYTFREEDIQRARDLVGVYHAMTQREQYTRASPDIMRNFARSYGDDNPLFTDEEYGTTTRWGGQIAPPMINIAVRKELLADPVPREQRRPSFRGIHVFVSGTTTHWYRPVLDGDILYGFHGTEKVEEKQSEFAGRSLIITGLQVQFNQRAEVVQTQRVITIHTERHESRKRKKYDAIEPADYTPDDIARIDEIYAAEQVRGATVRRWEDVEVGESLGTMAKGPLTTTDMVVFHSGGYGFAPYTPCSGRLAYKNRQRIAPFYIPNEHGIPDVAQRIHWDTGYARSIGLPAAYDYGMMRDCWLSHYLTDWMGDDGWLVTMSSQMRKFNYLGDTHTLTGEVVGKRVEDGRYLVDIELRGTSQRGEITCPATATVALPSRDAGPVALPTPPAEFEALAARMLERDAELRAARRAAREGSAS